jgi:purine-cytosine permease-like protein
VVPGQPGPWPGQVGRRPAGSHAFWLSFLLLGIAAIGRYAPYGPLFAAIAELLPRRTAGIAVAVVNAAAHSAASWVPGGLAQARHRRRWAAFLTLAGTMVAAAIVLLAVGRLATERRAEAAA